MKYYHLYMQRQEISPELHEKLLNLEPPKRSSRSVWVQVGALAACCALLVGLWQWADQTRIGMGGQLLVALPSDVSDPVSVYVFTVDEDHPLQTDVSRTGDEESRFVVSDSGVKSNKDKLAFPMIPYIDYPDRTNNLEVAASRAYAPGAFSVGLTKEDIQTIFWGPEGKPDAEHPKTEQGDLPWMLFWGGYTVHGFAWYENQGQLTELTIYGDKGLASFELELRLGALPFTCCIDLNRGDVLSEFNGVSIAGWSKVYDRNGDGETDYICGSEFMTTDNIGVRFVNQNGLMQAEYSGGESMDLGGSQTFNALFVRQALTGGLHLDHLRTAGQIPAWREETFSTLAQARQEVEFAPYLPTREPEGYSSYTGSKEFHGNLSYQEGSQNRLFVRWSRGYDDVEVCVYQGGYYHYTQASPNNPASYDVRLYDIPWCDSVPDEYQDTISYPAFRAEDMSLSIVEARGMKKDTGGLNFRFDVIHPDGTVVSYRCDGLTAQQVWEMVEETL